MSSSVATARRQHRRFQPYSASSSISHSLKHQISRDSLSDVGRAIPSLAANAAGQHQRQHHQQCPNRTSVPAGSSSQIDSSPESISSSSPTSSPSSSSSCSESSSSSRSSSSTATTPSLCLTGSTHASSSVGSPSPASSSIEDISVLASSSTSTIVHADGDNTKGLGIVAPSAATKPSCPQTQDALARSQPHAAQQPDRVKQGIALVDRTVRVLFQLWPVLLHQEAHATRQAFAATQPTVESDIKPPSTLSANCGSGALPIKLFVHELLRRSKSSGAVLQTALCYLEAYKTARQRVQQQPASQHTQSTVTVMTADELVLYELGQLDAAPEDKFPAGSLDPAESRGSPLDPLGCPRRTFLAALLLAQKFTSDRGFSNKAWAKLTGLTPLEVGRCERALAQSLEWRLWVGKPVTPVVSSAAAAPARELGRAQTMPSISFGAPPLAPLAKPISKSTLSRSVSIQDLVSSPVSQSNLPCSIFASAGHVDVSEPNAMDVTTLDDRPIDNDAPLAGADVDMPLEPTPKQQQPEEIEELQATIQVHEHRSDFGDESDSCETPCPLPPPDRSGECEVADVDDDDVCTPPTPALTMADSPASVSDFKSMTVSMLPLQSMPSMSSSPSAAHVDNDNDGAASMMLVDTASSSVFKRSKSDSHVHLAQNWDCSAASSTSDWLSSLPAHHVYAAA